MIQLTSHHIVRRNSEVFARQNDTFGGNTHLVLQYFINKSRFQTLSVLLVILAMVLLLRFGFVPILRVVMAMIANFF